MQCKIYIKIFANCILSSRGEIDYLVPLFPSLFANFCLMWEKKKVQATKKKERKEEFPPGELKGIFSPEKAFLIEKGDEPFDLSHTILRYVLYFLIFCE